jgi:hypothetical protein
MAAAVELRPVRDRVLALRQGADGGVVGEDGDARGDFGSLLRSAPRGGFLVVEVGRRGGGVGQPVEGDVGEQAVAVDRLLGWSSRLSPPPALRPCPARLPVRRRSPPAGAPEVDNKLSI